MYLYIVIRNLDFPNFLDKVSFEILKVNKSRKFFKDFGINLSSTVICIIYIVHKQKQDSFHSIIFFVVFGVITLLYTFFFLIINLYNELLQLHTNDIYSFNLIIFDRTAADIRFSKRSNSIEVLYQ